MASTSDLKYAHLAKPHPDLIPFIPLLDDATSKQWALVFGPNPDIAAFKATVKDGTLAAMVAGHFPQPGKDYLVRDESLTVRDGASIGMRFYEPLKEKRTGKEVLVMKFHGGGFIIGSHDIEEVENRLLAVDAGAVVASVDYRMAPEHRFPYSVNDCYDAMKWCVENAERLGVDKNKICLSGGSAGGNLVSVMALKARDEGFEKATGGKIQGVAAQIPATCHFDLFPKEKYEYTSLEQNAEAPTLKLKYLKWMWSQYVPDPSADMGAPKEYHSPLLAERLSGLPPFLVQVAGMDPLRDEGMAWAEALKEAGIPVELKVYPGLQHGFYFLADFPETREYWQAVVDFVKKQTGT